MSSILFCLRLSFGASRVYTVIRLIGKILVPIFNILTAYTLKNILDLLSGSGGISALTSRLLIYLILSGILVALTAATNKAIVYAEGLHNDLLEKQISGDMMDSGMQADLEMYDNPDFYDRFASVVQDSFALTNILWIVLDFISSLVSALASFTILCSVNVFYGVIITIASIPSGFANKKYTEILYHLSLDQVNDNRKKDYFYRVATDRQYAQDLRLYSITSVLKQKYISLWKSIFSTRQKQVKRRALSTGLWEFLPELIIIFMTFDLAYRVLNHTATIGDYSLYSSLLTQQLAGITTLIANAVLIYDNMMRIDNINRFRRIPPQVKDCGIKEIESIDSIEFSNVGFRYRGSSKDVLSGISFKITKGQQAALVGVNGSGKTTIIKLLLRFYEPDSGGIYINGLPIQDISLFSLRKQFSTYFQNAANYGFTIRENVAFGDWDNRHDNKRIMEALENAGATRILKKAENGIDTYMSRVFEESGIELSGGENQAIALARTFFRPCSILILDEPSSALDPEAEERLNSRLNRLCAGKTALYTSHRLSYVKDADVIFVIENGGVIETGTQKDLLESESRFSELYLCQATKYIEAMEQ